MVRAMHCTPTMVPTTPAFRWLRVVWLMSLCGCVSCGRFGFGPTPSGIDDSVGIGPDAGPRADELRGPDADVRGLASGDFCTSPQQCLSNVCAGDVCQSPTCADGVRNQDETDVDCGGAACMECLCAMQTDIPRLECDALYALYSATNGERWAIATNWLGNEPCTWFGVTCEGPPPSRVVSLDVSDNQLVGPIPAELGNLTALTNLSLGDNSLLGEIPPELGNLIELTTLSLAISPLSGTIPSELANLRRLEVLRLHETQLTGGIPAWLGSLVSLRRLTLQEANLTGAIPSELGNLVNLTELWLHENQLSGPVPETILGLTQLTSISLWGNLCLTGETSAVTAYLDSQAVNWDDGCSGP